MEHFTEEALKVTALDFLNARPCRCLSLRHLEETMISLQIRIRLPCESVFANVRFVCKRIADVIAIRIHSIQLPDPMSVRSDANVTREFAQATVLTDITTTRQFSAYQFDDQCRLTQLS